MVTCDPAAAGYITNLCKRRFSYEQETWDFKVKKGAVRRCGGRVDKKKDKSRKKVEEWIRKNNVEFQEKPVSGASIGAVREGFPLPPGTLGGVVEVGGECFGLTVHHLLEDLSIEEKKALGLFDESDEEYDDEEAEEDGEYIHVSATSGENDELEDLSDVSPLPPFPHPSLIHPQASPDELYWESDRSSLHSSTSSLSDDAQSINSSNSSTPSSTGDLPGFTSPPPSEFLHLTQPTFYDPSSNQQPPLLGNLHASSGLRRTRINNITHELDWALISIPSNRLPDPPNLIPGAAKYTSTPSTTSSLTPTSILPTSALTQISPEAKLYTIANGRSTGLDAGEINAGMSALLLPGRRSMSRSWQVVGRLGEPGDSGAWVCDSEGRVVGVVVASAELEGGGGCKWAYFCPMEVVVGDVAKTLGVKVGLPGGVEAVEAVKATELVEEEQVASTLGRVKMTRGKMGVENGREKRRSGGGGWQWASAAGRVMVASASSSVSSSSEGVCAVVEREVEKAVKMVGSGVAKGVGEMMPVVCG